LSENTVVLEVLAKAVEKIKYKAQQKLARSLYSEILPILKKIKSEKNFEYISILVELAIMRLKVFTPTPDNSFSLLEKLTPTEMSIASMIKDGFKSKDIAHLQFVSLNTVKTHRSNIRKKLNLKNKRINLASYLKNILN
jgi:DNA-binding NarL/FixJ family response regulator